LTQEHAGGALAPFTGYWKYRPSAAAIAGVERTQASRVALLGTICLTFLPDGVPGCQIIHRAKYPLDPMVSPPLCDLE
jgi:hypothetical protein